MSPDFKTVIKLVLSAKDTWFNLGVQLNIGMEELQRIGQKFDHNSKVCLREMLIMWLDMTDPAPSWEDLATALEKESVNHCDIASEIRKKFRDQKRSANCE